MNLEFAIIFCILIQPARFGVHWWYWRIGFQMIHSSFVIPGRYSLACTIFSFIGASWYPSSDSILIFLYFLQILKLTLRLSGESRALSWAGLKYNSLFSFLSWFLFLLLFYFAPYHLSFRFSLPHGISDFAANFLCVLYLLKNNNHDEPLLKQTIIWKNTTSTSSVNFVLVKSDCGYHRHLWCDFSSMQYFL